VKPGVAAIAQDVFTYTVRDADGDETTATLSIRVIPENRVPAPVPTDPATPTIPSPLDGPTGSQSTNRLLDSPVRTDPGMFFAGERFDEIRRLPIPFESIVYVHRQVSAAQAERERSDPRGFSDPQPFASPGRQPALQTPDLGFAPALFVTHAVRDSQRQSHFLNSIVEGRYSRTDLSSDGYLARPGLFGDSAIEWSRVLKQKGRPQGVDARQGDATHDRSGNGPVPAPAGGAATVAEGIEAAPPLTAGASAPSFAEQLRRGAAALPIAPHDS